MRWRAVFIPVLMVLTIVMVFQATSGPTESTRTDAAPSAGAAVEPALGAAVSPDAAAAATVLPSAGDTPAGAVPDLTNRDADGHFAATIAAGALPAGAVFVATGAGTWRVVPGTSPKRGTGDQHRTYTIEVEDGLQAPEQDQAFAAAVDVTLSDPRSWIGGGQVSLTRIDAGEPDFRISLTSQMTIRSPDECGWEVPLEASCFNGRVGRVFINDARWVRGAMSYGGDITSYRSYAVNHEVGHALGKRHEPCPGTGQPAPVMMQQSWSTSDDDLSILDPQTIPQDGKVCVANPYPFPDAAAVSPASPEPSATG